MKELQQKHKDLLSEMTGSQKESFINWLKSEGFSVDDENLVSDSPVQTTLSGDVRVVTMSADEFLDTLFVEENKSIVIFHDTSNQIKNHYPGSVLSTHLVPTTDDKHYMICQMTTKSYKYEMNRLQKEKSNVFELLTEHKGFRNISVQKDKKRGLTVITFEILK